MKIPFILSLLVPAALLAQEVDLLGGHLTMELPDAAKIGSRSRDIMSSMPGSDETLYWIGDHDNRIAVFAREELCFADPGFIEKATQGLKNFCPEDFEVRTVGDNIVYCLASKAAEEPNGQDCYAVAYVRTKEDMVLRVEFFFARKAAMDIKAARELIIEAVESVKDGAWSPNLKARTATVGQEWSMAINVPLPDGYFFVHDPGPDFDVYRFKEVRKPGSEGSGLSIYIGHNPNCRDMDTCKDKRSGMMLGKNIQWHHFPAQSNEEYYRAEVLIPLENCVFAHVFLHSDTEEKLAKLIAAAERITIDK